MASFQNFLAGHQYGTGLRQQREQQQREQQFNMLAGQAYRASPDKRNDIVGQAVGLNAERGMQLGETLGGVEDRRNRTLLNAAKLLTSAPDQYRNAVYQQIRQGLSQYIPNMPEQYDDTVAQAAQSIVSAYGGGQHGTAVQSRFIDDQGNVVALMRDGSTQVVGKADPSMQILEGEGGFYGVNRRNLQAAPVQLGGPAPQMPAPSQTVESSGRQVTIDPSLPPHVRAQIAANPDAFAALPEQADVTLPPIERQPTPPTQQLGGQLRPAAKERTSFVPLSSDEVEAAGLPAGTVAQRNVSTGQIQVINKPPSISEKAPTDSERKAATLLQRLNFSLGQLETAVSENPEAASPGMLEQSLRRIPLVGEAAANLATPQERQRVEAAQLDILDAALTLGTGAAYTREQLEGYRRSYFPQIGDDDATIADKAARLNNVIEAARIAAGRAAPGGAVGQGQNPAAARGRQGFGPVRVNSAADYEALPSGAEYIAPDGSRRRKR